MRPDSTATTLTGTVTVPSDRASAPCAVYTEYASSTMTANADDIEDSPSDTPYPRVFDVSFNGPASPNYRIDGSTTGTEQLIPAVAAISGAGWSGRSPYNWFQDFLTLSWVACSAGAYWKRTFTGTSLSIDFDIHLAVLAGLTQVRYPWYAVSIDGGAFTRAQVQLGAGPTVTASLATGLTSGTHTVELVVDQMDLVDRWLNFQPAALRIQTWTTNGAFADNATQRAKNLLVYGESEMEGYNANYGLAQPQSRASVSFIRQLASDLSAECGAVTYTGQGYLNPVDVPDLLDAYSLFCDTQSRLTAGLFSPVPDYIVIHHGTNDGGSSDAAVRAAVVTAMESMRAAASAAKIIVLLPVNNAAKTTAVTNGFTDYQAAHPADTNVGLATSLTRSSSLLTIAADSFDGGSHYSTDGHTAVAPIIRSAVARALGVTTKSYQVRADLDSVLQGFYDVDDDGGWEFFNAVGTGSRWEFTLITYPGTVSLLPKWTSVVADYMVSSVWEIRESAANLEDADGAYPSINPAPAFSDFVTVNSYLHSGTLTAEVDKDPPGGVSNEARCYILWNTVTGMSTGAPLYAMVPDRREVNNGADPQYVDVRMDVVRLTDHQAWVDTLNVAATGLLSVAKPDGERYQLGVVDVTAGLITSQASITNGIPREFFFYAGDTDVLDLLSVPTLALGSDFEEVAFGYASAVVCLAFLTLARLETDTTTQLRYQENARAIAHGLMAQKQVDDGLPFAYPQRFVSDLVGLRYYRTGSICWEWYAAMATLDELPDDLWAGSYAAWKTLIETNMDLVAAWVYGQMDSTGLVRGGTGREVAGVLDPSYQVPDHPAEHNFDAWFAFTRRANRGLTDEVAPGVTYQSVADTLRTNILATMWRADAGRFSQSVDEFGAAIASGVLDSHSWGALFLIAVGETTKATSELAFVDSNYRTTSAAVASGGAIVPGFTELVAADGVLNSVASVWVEGTCGKLIAARRLGTPDTATHTALARLQQSDGSYRNFQKNDTTYGVRNFRSLMAAAWFVLSYYPDVCLWTEML